MNEPRLIQNFRNFRGVLCAGVDFGADTLEKTLAKLGMTCVRTESLDHSTLNEERDVLFVDGDLPFKPSLFLRVGSRLPVAPVIGIVGVEAPSRLRLLVEAGVTAFLRKPLHAGTIYSALFLGVNGHRRLRAMEERLADNDRRRHGRRFVIKAVVALVQGRGLSEDEAYAQLRRASMRERLGIEEFCAALFADGGGMFPDGWKSGEAPHGYQPQAQEIKNASHIDEGRSPVGIVGADIRESG